MILFAALLIASLTNPLEFLRLLVLALFRAETADPRDRCDSASKFDGFSIFCGFD